MASTIVWDNSLSGYKVFGSQTPSGFTAKRERIPDHHVNGITTVFIDVLRATSTLLAVGSSGCKGIYVSVKPRQENSTYEFVAPSGAPLDAAWVFGGELNGLPINGYDASGNEIHGVISNSPLDASDEIFEGTYLRFFSTNGSEILDAILAGGLTSVYAMAVANVQCTVDHILRETPDRIWFTCGAFYGGLTLEDGVIAGLAIDRLVAAGYADESQLDDEAWNMLTAARFFMRDGALDTELLLNRVNQSQVGTLLASLDHGRDIPASITLEGFSPDLVDRMQRTLLKVETGVGSFVVPTILDGNRA